ncbi:DUF4041 domain-containing protein [Bacillus cereus]|uniref:DUF4041 domain-containing protein n=1 Tax=Bacillus cereus TaxID=1396 RepID=UPI000BEB76D4|nr:DUF4041 domain-containing protein [Bacillus cereus]PEF94025.1 chromosome partitioning protein ParA [Bacillus cereus]
MGLMDYIKGKEHRQNAEKLQDELNVLKQNINQVDKMTALELSKYIEEQKSTLATLQEEVSSKEHEIKNLELKIAGLLEQSLSIEDELSMESFGLYKPRYSFSSSLHYKTKLDEIRNEQKIKIKTKTAVNYFKDWTVDGNKAKGTKMTNDNIKSILRSFNNECEATINKITYSNFDRIENRIRKSFEQLNKLYSTVRVSIDYDFLNLKLDELHLAYEYELKKQEEKDALREQREREREEKALQKEIQSKKKIIDKEITHFKNMISELQDKLKGAAAEEKMEIAKQISELEGKVVQAEKDKEELDYRTANASAGYVYIISNIGAFGKDIVKIGVTRRLDPLERIAELSSASVPFKFDVHALIFSYDAYKLESELHKYFDKQRVNRVNHRKEFFKVKIDEVEKLLETYKDLTIDFTKVPEAEEYRQGLSILNETKK